MMRIRGDVTIRRAGRDVAAFLADASNEPKWQKGIVHLQLQHGRAGEVGARYERVQEAMGRNIKTTLELTERRDASRVAFRSAGKMIDLAISYELSAAGDATKVEARVEGEMLGFAAMFEGMVAEQLQKTVPRDLERLREVLESPS